LRKTLFSRSQGIFKDVYQGNLTEICKEFNKKSTGEGTDGSISESYGNILKLLIERDEAGRTPFDLAW
jgi:hypothetical protein